MGYLSIKNKGSSIKKEYPSIKKHRLRCFFLFFLTKICLEFKNQIMKKSLLLFLASNLMLAQVGINTGGTIDSGAVLEVKSSSKGVLLPRLSDHTAITSPTPGMLIYDIADQCINYYAGTSWVNPCDSGGTATGSGNCSSSDGTVYPSAAMKSVERGNAFVVGVSADGDLLTSGMFSANGNQNLISGGTTLIYRDATIVSGPWGSTPIIASDITSNVNNQIGWAAATADQVYYTNHQSTDSFKPITLNGAPAGTKIADVQASHNRIVILTEDGDVYQTSLGNFSRITNYEAEKVNLPEKVTKLENSDQSVVAYGGTSGKLYAWEGNCTLYVNLQIAGGDAGCRGVTTPTKDAPAEYSTTSSIVDFAIGNSTFTYVTADGKLHRSNNSGFDVDEIKDASGNSILASGEKIINTETYSNTVVVTDKGRILNRNATEDYWYNEYEVAAKDPASVDITLDNVANPVTAIVDGDFYQWDIERDGTSTIPPRAVGGNWEQNSPLKVNVCLDNK